MTCSFEKRIFSEMSFFARQIQDWEVEVVVSFFLEVVFFLIKTRK
jgi:hypothetical protein